jgi:transposase
MKVLIGVDPHKASLAVAAIDEASGEFLERAAFAQDRAGLRSLERWAKRFPERRWAVENAGGLGRHLAVRLAGSGESVVDVPPARTTDSTPSPPPWPPRVTKGLRR